jgi:tetratricopeptide (TPR) repeat protein
VADKDEEKAPAKGAEQPFDPKPVQVGGESIVDRLLPHKKKILIFLLSGFAIWGVIAIVIHFRDKKRENNTEGLAAVLDVAARPVRPAGQPVDPNAKEPTFGDVKERAGAILSELSQHGGDAAGPAFRASQLLTAGKIDDAIAEFRTGQKAPGLDGVLAREGLGLALEAKAQDTKDAAASQKLLEEALAAFTAMQPDEKGPLRAYALYHQGRLLVLLGKKGDAKAAFQKAKDLAKERDADLAELVDERIALLGA